MSKSDQINAELDQLGIKYDPASHWKTRETLLNEAKAILTTGGERSETTVELPPGDYEVSVNLPPAPVIVTAPTVPTATTDAEPAADPMAGDKTPELVEWRRRNWTPEQFAKQYAGRRINGEIIS